MKTYVIDIADPTEDEPASIAAAHALLESGDRVVLFHYIFHQRLVEEQGNPAHRLVAEARDLLMASRTEQLAALAGQFANQDVRCEVVWTDNGWQSLVNFVRDQKADMLIAQSERPSRWRPLTRANDDWQLIRHCPVPLLLARPECGHQYKQILAAVDPLHVDDKPAELDYRILDHASEISARHNASLCVLNVAVPVTVSSSIAAAPIAEAQVVTKEIVTAHRERLATILEELGIDIAQICVIPGLPAQEIVKHAQDQNADLVVMGAVSRSALRNLLIGNTAEKVLDQIAADTLIIKPFVDDSTTAQ
ncbi:MAG: universal stress protein [Gammaproteobacteria bacterium]